MWRSFSSSVIYKLSDKADKTATLMVAYNLRSYEKNFVRHVGTTDSVEADYKCRPLPPKRGTFGYK